MQYNKKLLNNFFSHIYVEEKALNYDLTNKIINRFKHSKIIIINNYKDIFFRKKQNFNIQKYSNKLILAVKENNFFYKSSELCQNFGNPEFYYSSAILNCIYDCEYCFLKGLYFSSYITVFVNIEDFFSDIEKNLENKNPYLAVSFDSDILALNSFIPYASYWINYAEKHPSIDIEIRTKSININSIKNMKPIKNVILAWTLSPEEIISKFEKKTPKLKYRISAIKNIIDAGWNVRICIDPIIAVHNWEDLYGELIDTIFSNLPSEKLKDMSIGTFRIGKQHFQNMQKYTEHFQNIFCNFEQTKNTVKYSNNLEQTIMNFIKIKILPYYNLNKVYFDNNIYK